MIGPVAPSLSGRVTAPVSNRRETGSGVSARGAAAEGIVLPCSLPFARGSARSLAEQQAGLQSAWLQAQPPPGKQRQLVPVRDGERAKLTSPPPTLLSSCSQVRSLLQEVPTRGPAPGVRGTPHPSSPEPENFTPSPASGLRGRCPEPDTQFRAREAVREARTAVGGRRPAGNFITVRVITTFYCFSPRRGCSQLSVALACLPKEPLQEEDPEGSCLPRGYLQPSRGVWAAWMRRTQPRSR